ncbi:MAG TPA: hypothetical protein VFD15_03510 [Clostridia bacterium]|nr:hypothetical protein [Clostridia bacterium]
MLEIRRFISLSIFIFLLCIVMPAAAYAQEPGKVVMVVIDRLTFEDIENMPVLQGIIDQSALGLLNTKTGGIRSSENACATIGSSVPALATGSAQLAFNGTESYMDGTASMEYMGRTGVSAPEQWIFQLGIARIWQQNATLNQNVVPGALGEALAKGGHKVGVLGNGDLNDEISRPAVNIAMNNNGLVEEGNVGKDLIVHDRTFPGGKRTDYNTLFEQLVGLIDRVSFTVVDVADLARLENQENYVFEDNLDRLRTSTVKRIDSFLLRVTNTLDLKNDLLMVVSPTPSDNVVKRGELITPVIMAGKGMDNRGLLTSGTTKRPGIITNTDLAPTVLTFFNIEVPYHMWGRNVTVEAGDNSLNVLVNFKNKLALIYSMRPPLIKGYIFTLLILLLVSLYFIFFRKDGLFILKPFLIFVMSVPLAFLILPLLPGNSSLTVALELVLLALSLSFLCISLGKRWFLGSFLLISVATVAAIVIDLYMGSPLQKQSILGYDAIAGARFYGLGNEYMGVLLGATIIGSMLLITALPKFKKALVPTVAVVYFIVLYAIAAPNVGTNVGGTIAGSVGFVTALLLLLNIKFSKRTILLVPVAALLVVVSFIFIDLQKDIAHQSHIGRNANLILSGGLGEIFNIIMRKLEVNIKLIKHTIWSRFFLASLASLALLFYRPVGVMKNIRSNYQELFYGFIATIIAAVTALVFNDSGIVAAATTMIFGVPPFIYLVLYEQPVKI